MTQPLCDEDEDTNRKALLKKLNATIRKHSNAFSKYSYFYELSGSSYPLCRDHFQELLPLHCSLIQSS
jgi:hypothetical protein